MREIRIKSAGDDDWQKIATIARDLGIGRLSRYEEHELRSGRTETVLSAELSTPRARELVGAVIDAPFYAPDRITITSRELRSVVTKTSVPELTVPLIAPTSDIRQELWQFSHLTTGLIVRTASAALLLAYGILKAKLLVMAAGLLFLPVTTLFLAIAFGLDTREGPLVRRALGTLTVITCLLVVGGLAVGLLTTREIGYTDIERPLTGALLSLAIGVAGAIATGDDVARRELIGLAAASQFAIVPAWLGLALARGDLTGAGSHLLGFAINVATLTLGATLTYVVLRMRHVGETKRKRPEAHAGGSPNRVHRPA